MQVRANAHQSHVADEGGQSTVCRVSTGIPLNPVISVKLASWRFVIDVYQHQLIFTQQARLDTVIGSFLSFEAEGIGCTNLFSHVLDVEIHLPVKQRYFAISSVIEKLDVIIGSHQRIATRWASSAILEVKLGKAPWCSQAKLRNCWRGYFSLWSFWVASEG